MHGIGLVFIANCLDSWRWNVLVNVLSSNRLPTCGVSADPDLAARMSVSLALRTWTLHRASNDNGKLCGNVDRPTNALTQAVLAAASRFDLVLFDVSVALCVGLASYSPPCLDLEYLLLCGACAIHLPFATSLWGRIAGATAQSKGSCKECATWNVYAVFDHSHLSCLFCRIRLRPRSISQSGAASIVDWPLGLVSVLLYVILDFSTHLNPNDAMPVPVVLRIGAGLFSAVRSWHGGHGGCTSWCALKIYAQGSSHLDQHARTRGVRSDSKAPEPLENRRRRYRSR